MNLINYIILNHSLILEKAGEHVVLAGISVLIACAIGVPVGFMITSSKKAASIVINIANIIQTIPSLALFAFAMPLFGIGTKPAIFALSLYALLPIIKNTLIGINNVNPATIEAARGMGMSKTQIMFRVEIPLAISVIMGGVRIATVTCIGIATIAALIGAGGLGQLIYQGISMMNYEMILAGAISSALLALLVDYILGLIEHSMTSEGISPRADKKGRGIKLLLILLVATAVIGTTAYTVLSEKKPTVVIGHKDFTEQRLTGQLMITWLESKGYRVKNVELGGTILTFTALRNGDIDIYPEYTGTGYSAILKQKDILGIEETYKYVKDTMEKEYGITWLNPFGFNNTYVLSIRADTMKKYNIRTLDDIIPLAGKFRMGCDKEFQNRADGLPGLIKEYPGLEFAEVIPIDQGLTYAALNNGDIDINVSYSTDGRIAKFNLKNLEDSRNFFPPYYLTPIVQLKFAEKYPEIVEALNELGNLWTEAEMQKYNLMVDEGAKVKDVATLMLQDKGLLK